MKKLVWFIMLIIMNGALVIANGIPETDLKTYENKEYGFSISYPGDFKEVPVIYQNEVIRLAVQNDFKVPVLTVSAQEKSSDLNLSEIPRKVIAFMQASMPATSNYEILNEDVITLDDKTQAAWIEFSWVLDDGKTVMKTASVVAFNENYQITITGNTLQGLGFPVNELTKICKTLKVTN